MRRIGAATGFSHRLPGLASATAKLIRAYCTTVETRRRLRSGGEQNIRVEHVHVHEGGQAIVGAVTTRKGLGFELYMMRALTLSETAAELRKSPRWLQDWLAKNPVDAFGKPFCSKLGRTRVFREADIARILDATMDRPCPSKSARLAPEKRQIIQSGERTSALLWTEAQELLRKPLQSSSDGSSKPQSNVVNIPQHQSSRTPPHS